MATCNLFPVRLSNPSWPVSLLPLLCFLSRFQCFLLLEFCSFYLECSPYPFCITGSFSFSCLNSNITSVKRPFLTNLQSSFLSHYLTSFIVFITSILLIYWYFNLFLFLPHWSVRSMNAKSFSILIAVLPQCLAQPLVRRRYATIFVE